MPNYQDYSSLIPPLINPSSIPSGSFLPNVPSPTLNNKPSTVNKPNTNPGGFLGTGLPDWIDPLDPFGLIDGLFGSNNAKSYPQPYAQGGNWYSQFADPSSPNAFSRSPVNPVPITNIPGASQSPSKEYGQLANNVRSVQDLLPFITQASNQADLQKSLGQLETAQTVAPGQAALMTNLYNTFGSQLNAIGNEINRRNMLAQAGSENQVLQGPGKDLVNNAYQLSQVYDKPYYDTRQTTANRLGDLLNSIDLSGKLSGSEQNEIGQGLARQNQQAGTLFSPSQLNTVSNAERYGQAGYQRQQTAKSNLAQAINASAGFLPASKSGVDVFQVATGRSSMPNPGNSLFPGVSGVSNSGDQAANAMFGGYLNQGGQNNQMNMLQAQINANKKDWLDQLSQITGSIGNITSMAGGMGIKI